MVVLNNVNYCASCWAWVFRWLGPIHLIARSLINWICVCMVKWNTILSHLWKFFQMALMKEKIIGPTSLNIYKPDNSFCQNLDFVVALR